MTETKLPYGVAEEQFEKVTKYLHAQYDETNHKKSRVSREQLLMDLFNISKSDPQYQEVRHTVELVARASKTDAGIELFEKINGKKGFVQATVVNKKSYYETVMSGTVEKYNPRNKENVERLVDIVAPLIVEKPTASAEEIASLICRRHGYVIGSILPTVGTIRARYNGVVAEVTEKFVSEFHLNKGLLFSADKAGFMKLAESIFDSSKVSLTNKELSEIVLEKLKRK